MKIIFVYIYIASIFIGFRLKNYLFLHYNGYSYKKKVVQEEHEQKEIEVCVIVKFVYSRIVIYIDTCILILTQVEMVICEYMYIWIHK